MIYGVAVLTTKLVCAFICTISLNLKHVIAHHFAMMQSLCDDAAEHVYDFLALLLANCDHIGTIPIIEG